MGHSSLRLEYNQFHPPLSPFPFNFSDLSFLDSNEK